MKVKLRPDIAETVGTCGATPGGRVPAKVLLVLAALAVTTAAGGCRDGNDANVRTIVPLPTIRVDSPEWSGVGDDEIVATIDDIRIPAWRVKRALGEAPVGTSPDEAMYTVIAEELIARMAAGDTGFVPDRKSYERILASRYIDKMVIEDFPPEKVPMTMLQEAFAMPQVWAKFNHYDLYEIQDYQWICCSDPRDCDPAVSDYCFKEGQDPMNAVYNAVVTEQPDPGDLAIMAAEYKKLAYHLTYQEFQFAFDRTAGYQKGVTHIDEKLVTRIMETPEGGWISPTRSGFGWHVSYVAKHHLEVHGDLNDPEVRQEIARTFIQRFRQQHFLELLAGLVATDRLKLLETYYENRLAPATTPAYDVVIDSEALRQATAVEAMEHQEQVPIQ